MSLDLDDTLWPVRPALQRADQAVQDWLQAHQPEVARCWPLPALRDLREQIAIERTDLAHDFTTQRQLTLQHAFAACGVDEAPLDVLWDIYFAARNDVELYPDSLPALRRLAARWPLASLTNGNADLQRIGLHTHFVHHVCARDTGVAKPDVRIFRAAAKCLDVPVQRIMHVGDDPRMDVVGAREAGMRSVWINRQRDPWPASLGAAPELDLPDLAALADWLDANHPAA